MKAMGEDNKNLVCSVAQNWPEFFFCVCKCSPSLTHLSSIEYMHQFPIIYANYFLYPVLSMHRERQYVFCITMTEMVYTTSMARAF